MSSEALASLSIQRIRFITIFALSFFPLVGMGVDLLAPSLPAISEALHVSGTISKNLIAIYLVAYAIGNFLNGIWSDALGRRGLLIYTFLIFIAASLLPILATNTGILLIARFLQGFAIGAYGVVSRAMLSDVLSQEKLIKIAPIIAVMWGIGPIIGPVLGGYLQFYFDWQANFYFFAFYGLIGLVMIYFFIPETHLQRQPLNYSQVRANMAIICTHRVFIGMSIIMGMFYSLIIVFNTLGPFLIQVEFGHSSVYFGHIAMTMGIAFLAGALLCRYLLASSKPEKMLLIGLPVFLFIAVSGLGFAYVADKNIWIVIIFSFLMFLGTGILYPGAMGRCLSLFRHLAGNSIAVMNFINVLITGLIAMVMSFISANSMVPLAWIYLILIILSGLVYGAFIWRPNSSNGAGAIL